MEVLWSHGKVECRDGYPDFSYGMRKMTGAEMFMVVEKAESQVKRAGVGTGILLCVTRHISIAGLMR